MKSKLILNNKEYEVEITEEQVKEIKKPKGKRWRAEKRKTYFNIYLDGTACIYTELGDATDKFLYSIGNYFRTKEEAEEYRKKLLYRQQYKDFIGEDLVTKDDWKDDNILKYCASYDHDDNTVFIRCNTYIKSQGTIFSKSKEKIQEFIKKIGEENFKKYILEVEE